MTTDNILDDLNESQREAVVYEDGPALVIAGAGSGKTRVLTYKIAYLIQRGMKPWNILALTFTNKAATEMKARIAQLVGQEVANYLHMGTFHSIFSRILRREAQWIGYQPNFTIYDESDSRSLIKSIAKDMGLDDKVYKPATVHGRISMAKNNLVSAEVYADDFRLIDRDRHSQLPELHRIYSEYQQRLRQANAMDFDDLLMNTYALFREHEEVRQRYANHFQYVLVDEYQDTNTVQQWIMLQLTKERQRVCVVGDDYQSIYAFRGAKIDNILGFQKEYDHVRLFKLEQNYRSTKQIVEAANSLMKHNKRQIDKDVYSNNAKGERITLYEAYSDREEAAIVCKSIQRLKRTDECGYSNFAILYRTNAQSRAFEEEMRNRAIPYRIFGGLSFYQRKEIKDIIAYFRMVVNPDDEEAFRRVVNYPARGIGDTTLQKIAATAAAYGVSLWYVVNHPVECQRKVSKGTLGKLGGFVSLITESRVQLAEADACTLGKLIIQRAGIDAVLREGNDAESIARRENLDEFLNSMSEFVANRREEGREEQATLVDFLQEVSLLTDLDSDDDDDDKVNLMTVHAAKGLEFDTVFVVGMEENIFPSSMAMNSERELEEERRLLYVAITRAKRHCFLSCARNRWRYGKMECFARSRFINDIAPEYLHVDSKQMEGSQFKERQQGFAQQLPWETDYESNRPYRGTSMWGSDNRQLGNRWQNTRPVACQFMADLKPKQTSPRKAETAVDPFSESFKKRLAAHGGNLKRVSEAIANGGRALPDSRQQRADAHSGLAVGMVIEHQRFGRGTVVKLEGTGDNEKATVTFQHTGTKQLLLKFARFTIVQ